MGLSEKLLGVNEAGHTGLLKRSLGPVLATCLQEVSMLRPADPIQFISEWLYKFADNKLYYARNQNFYNSVERTVDAERKQRNRTIAKLKTLNMELLRLEAFQTRLSEMCIFHADEVEESAWFASSQTSATDTCRQSRDEEQPKAKIPRTLELGMGMPSDGPFADALLPNKVTERDLDLDSRDRQLFKSPRWDHLTDVSHGWRRLQAETSRRHQPRGKRYERTKLQMVHDAEASDTEIRGSADYRKEPPYDSDSPSDTELANDPRTSTWRLRQLSGGYVPGAHVQVVPGVPPSAQTEAQRGSDMVESSTTCSTPGPSLPPSELEEGEQRLGEERHYRFKKDRDPNRFSYVGNRARIVKVLKKKEVKRKAQRSTSHDGTDSQETHLLETTESNLSVQEDGSYLSRFDGTSPDTDTEHVPTFSCLVRAPRPGEEESDLRTLLLNQDIDGSRVNDSMFPPESLDFDEHGKISTPESKRVNITEPLLWGHSTLKEDDDKFHRQTRWKQMIKKINDSQRKLVDIQPKPVAEKKQVTKNQCGLKNLKPKRGARQTATEGKEQVTDSRRVSVNVDSSPESSPTPTEDTKPLADSRPGSIKSVPTNEIPPKAKEKYKQQITNRRDEKSKSTAPNKNLKNKDTKLKKLIGPDDKSVKMKNDQQFLGQKSPKIGTEESEYMTEDRVDHVSLTSLTRSNESQPDLEERSPRRTTEEHEDTTEDRQGYERLSSSRTCTTEDTTEDRLGYERLSSSRTCTTEATTEDRLGYERLSGPRTYTSEAATEDRLGYERLSGPRTCTTEDTTEDRLGYERLSGPRTYTTEAATEDRLGYERLSGPRTCTTEAATEDRLGYERLSGPRTYTTDEEDSTIQTDAEMKKSDDDTVEVAEEAKRERVREAQRPKKHSMVKTREALKSFEVKKKSKSSPSTKSEHLGKTIVTDSSGSWLLLGRPGVIVFRHPILGDLRTPARRQLIDDDSSPLEHSPCQVLYDLELYTVCYTLPDYPE